MIGSINKYDTIDKYNKLEANMMKINKNMSNKNTSFQSMLDDKNNIFDKTGKIDQKKLNKNQKKLFDSCIEIESFFWKQLLNEMKKTINKYKLLDGGQAEEIFTDMLYDEYSKMMAKNSNTNIAVDMFKQLYKNI
jgi:flagellar protein FlgJ